MKEKSSGNSGGIGFVGLLQVVFITLKLLGKIDWSWLMVFSPIWGSFVLAILVFVVIMFVLIIKGKIDKIKHEKWRKNL